MQNNQSNTVDSVQNKELLWTTLQESGAFAGLPSDRFQPVYAAFERSVQEASKSSMSLSDANKHIMRQFVQSLRSTNAIPNQNQNNNNAPKKKKIEMVYRAEDLQTERAGEFERQLREKQAEMDSLLTLKKPTDVSFTDLADDKPIGDEMSRLIANELAARERELVQLKPEDIKRAQQWIGTTDNNTIKPELHPSNNGVKKSVSFSEEEHEVEQFEPNNANANEFSENNFEETDFILSKFKRISEPLPDIGLSVAGSSVAGSSVASLSVAGSSVASLSVASLSVASLPEPNAIASSSVAGLSVASSSVAGSSVASSSVAGLSVASLSVASLSVASLSMQQLYNKLLDLEESMNTRHAEIMARLKRAYRDGCMCPPPPTYHLVRDDLEFARCKFHEFTYQNSVSYF
jgi:hypothetical protein